MKLLLDTHAFLWFIDDSPRLSARAKALLESDEDLFLSTASLWEIAIKTSSGKLALAQPFDIFLPQQLSKNEIEILPIRLAHLGVVSTLPLHHRDPFDRLLIAQAMFEQMPMISIDTAFDAYPVTRLW
ncbi:MAG: type II toxin-antitoxin system VapC family toxin [Pyrinomonadaceae bacterium]